MLNKANQILDFSEIQSLAFRFCKNLELGDVIMLKGELGVGKTFFCREIIKSLYSIQKISVPSFISSPTYPILLTYNLNSYEIYHYDLFRIKNINELEELDFFENIQNSITLIEWPELLLKLPFKQKYYLINFELYSETERIINLQQIKQK